MALSFTVKAKGFFDFVARFSKKFEERQTVLIKKGMEIISESARDNHRFQNDTFTLQDRAIKSEIISKRNPIIGKVFLDEGEAPYGPLIHDGFRGWTADPFLFDAIRRVDPKLKKLFKFGIISVTNEVR